MLKQLTPEHRYLAIMLGIGYSPNYVQQKSGKSRQTLYNLQKDELFMKEVEECAAEYRRQVMTKVVVARTKLEDAINEAVQRKIDLMKQTDNLNVANNAASDILAMAGLTKKLDEVKKNEGTGRCYLTDTEDDTAPKDVPAEEMYMFLDGVVSEDDLIKED